MNYKTVLENFRQRRAKILAYVASGKSHGQAAIKFKLTRQRIQQIVKNGR